PDIAVPCPGTTPVATPVPRASQRAAGTPSSPGAAPRRAPSIAPASRPSGRVAFDPLLDRAEDAAAVAVEHLDAHAVAEGQERRHRLAGFQRLHRALLCKARGAERRVLVGDRAGTDDGAGRQR